MHAVISFLRKLRICLSIYIFLFQIKKQRLIEAFQLCRSIWNTIHILCNVYRFNNKTHLFQLLCWCYCFRTLLMDTFKQHTYFLNNKVMKLSTRIIAKSTGGHKMYMLQKSICFRNPWIYYIPWISNIYSINNLS